MLEKKSELRTRLQQVQQELEGCEAKWRNVISRSPHGILIVDTEGTIRFANQAATVIFGCRMEELVGERFEVPTISGKPSEMTLKSRDDRTVAVEMWQIDTEWGGEPASLVALNDVTERKQSEQELRKLSRAVMESPSMVMITDVRGAIEYVNPKFTAVTGYTFAETVGRNPSFLKSGMVPPEVFRELWETVSRGKEWRGEMINRKKNGEIYWESASIAPVSDFEGNITSYIAVTEDITERKQMEEALRDSEERFRATFDQVAVGIAHLDPSGRLLRINRRYCEIVGYAEEELKQLTFQEITHPDDLAASVERYTLLRAGKIRDFSLEKRYLRKDGTPVWVNLTASLVSGPDGEKRFTVSVIEDIAARKAAEKALQDSRNRAQTIVSSALDAVVEIDDSGTIFSWNPKAEETFGWTAEEAIGKRPSETIIPAQYREAHEKGLKQFLATGEGPILNRHTELSALHRDGREFPVELTVVPIRTESGYTFSAFLRDISERKRAEERFRGLLESAPDAMIIVDGNGEICIVNSQTEKLFGYGREELFGQKVEILIPERFRSRHAEQREEYLRDPHVRQLGTVRDLYGQHKDGHEFPVDISLSPLYTAEGILVIAAVRDVTDRKRMDEALRSSEARYRALFRDNPTMIVTLDASLTMLTANPACADQLGYTIDELEGQSVLTLFHEDDRPAVAEQLQACLEHPGTVYHWRFRKTRKNGETIWVEELAQAGHGLDGAPNILVVCQDITERRRTENALLKSEKKFSAIFHTVPAMIALTTPEEGRCIDINETCLRILGYQREEIVGRTMLELGVWESKADRDRILRELEEKGFVRDLEIKFRSKDGNPRIGLFSAEFVDFNDERYMLSMVSDITERKRMAEEIERLNTDLAARAAELESANRELEAFNYSVSHDLRKPLTVINGYCQAITELCGERLDEQCLSYLRETYDGTLRMNRLIDALLNFSRLTSVELSKKTVDLGALATSVAAELHQTDPERRVTFRIAEGITVEGDANLLRVVLDNLLGNAWKYTGKQAEAVIEFGAAEIDGTPACFVRDNGTGFDMAHADKLFAPFKRLPGAEEYRGHGIGLATVERIIRRHGGRVWAEGEPGKGATFFFTLPAAGT